MGKEGGVAMYIKKLCYIQPRQDLENHLLEIIVI